MKVKVKGLRIKGQYDPEAYVTLEFQPEDLGWREPEDTVCLECGCYIALDNEEVHTLWHVRLLGVYTPDSEISYEY